MKFLYSITLLALSLSLFSQRSKDGAVTISTANTIVNIYTPVTADANAGSTTVNVGSSAGFNVGDLVLIIQMQGARVNAQWDTIWGDLNNSMSVPNSNNIDFGSIKDYRNAGNNEFAEISSIPNGTSIILDCGLKSSYTYSYTNYQGCFPNGSGVGHTMYGHVQVIKVPRYSSLTISGGGSITCPQWNGNTGGVAVVEVENNATLSSTPSFNVSGKGFRGGIKDNASSVFGGNKWGALNQNQGGYKGESIMGDTTTAKDYAALIGRGAIANGGGGGDAHNAGGGGGANGGVIASYNGYGNPAAGYTTIWNLEAAGFSTNTSSGGGRGGYSFSNQNRNVNIYAPGLLSTTTNTWGGDMRRNAGGLGGRPLDYTSGRIYLGGGGGAGDGNENQAGAGGNGGGLVYVVCYGNLSGAGTIIADGSNGSNSSPGCSSNDGAGGGGGGGTILLKVNGTISLSATTALSALGGNGGNVNFNCVTTNYDGYGPGGGGGGGYISSTGTIPSNSILGGSNGIQSGNGGGSASSISNAFPPNGATKGGSGSTGSITAYTLTPSASQTVCTNQSFTVTASSTEPSTSISWYNSNVGGSAIATGTAYASPGYTTAGTYTLFAGVCPGTYRQPITITVNSGLTISVNSPTICPSQTVVLTASGATTYTWNTGPNTSTISIFPSSTTVYTVNGTSGLCSGTKTTAVTVSSQPTITVANTTICAGNSATLTANGATNYTWSPGGQTTTSIVVTPTVNTTYTITGSNGACTNTTTATVSITSTPTLSASSKTICEGQTATFTVSGATSYTWNPGSITGTTYTTNATSSGTVSVIGASGTCTSQITTSLTVSPTPTIAVANQTICPTQSVTLTASGASTYTWSTGPNTTTISVAPSSTTVYTVNGTSNSCNSLKTVTVTVASQPTVSVASTTICSGSSTTLTANGATNYTWSPGGQTTTSIVVTPTTTTTYSITGFNGTCTNSTTATVSVTTTPTLVTNSSTICPGQTATLTVNGATSYTWNPGSVTGSTYTMATASNTVVSVIGANGTCTSSATASITIGTGISITVNSPTICAGQIASLTASGATTYTWNTGPNTSTINVSPLATTVYTISGTSGSCSGLNTATVNVIGQPTVSVANASICSGSSATLTANGATSYTWASGGQTTSSIVVTPTTNTTYTITGSNGICTTTTSALVNVTSTPTLVANSVTICPAQTATLNVSGATNYTWTPGNTNGTTYTIAPASNTTVSVIGANGTCTSSATASITIGTGISISVNSETICAGQTASLTASGATTYTWDSGVNTNTLNVNPISTTIYTIAGTNGFCNGVNTATVTVVSQPTITVNSSTICAGSSATLIASGATTYSWNPGNLTGTSISVSPTVSTTYTVTGSNSVCANTSTAIVSVINCSSACSFNLGNDTAFCSPLNYTINGPIGYDTYLWAPGGTTNQNLNITAGGTYTCTASIYSNDLITNGNFSTGNTGFTTSYALGTGGTWGPVSNAGTYSVTTNPNLAHSNFFSFGDHTSGTGNMMVCNGSAVANTVVWSQTISIVPSTNYIFSAWVASTENMNPGDEAQLQFSINGSLVGSVFNAPLTGGNWVNFFTNWNSGANTSATITIVDQNTIGNNDFALDDIFFQQICTHSDQITIIENNIPTVTANTTNSVICNGNTTSLIGGGASTYSWTNGVTDGVSFSPTITTTYTVIGSSAAGCTNTAVQTITVNPTPTITVTNAAVCSGVTATLVASGANTYTWSTNANGNSINVNPTSTTTYTVSGTDANGCTNNTISTVNIYAIPVADFNSSEGDFITLGSNVTLNNTSVNSDTYEWEILCTGQTSTSPNLNIAFADTGNCCINLVATNIAGCSDTVKKCVTIIKEAVVLIPNVFTPNGDGINDVFKINSSGLKTLTCAIYDRWGLKMYEWDGLNGYWDGATKSGLAPDGTYFYITTYSDFKDKLTTEKGFLNLFKSR